MSKATAQAAIPAIAPGPRGVGSLLRILRDPLGQMTAIAREHGPVARVKLGARVNHLVTSPDHVRHVLVDGAARYHKGRTFEKTRGYLGNGLATSAGDFWRRQRRIMQPHFHKEQIRGVGELMTRTIGETVALWQARAERGETFDAWADMMSMALHVTTRSLFGAIVDQDVAAIVESFQIALDHTTSRVLAPVEIPAWLPIASNLRFRRAIRTLDEIVYRVIDQQREQPEAANLLAVLLASRDAETGESMSAEQLRDEVMTLMLGGHETTGNALAWTWYLLAKNPAVDATMREEIAALAGKPPGMEDLARLAYTQMVFQESLRLYPQNWVMSRDTLEEDEIAGYTIPADTTVFLGVYVVHRDPAHWSEPERFDPLRFTAEAARGRDPFAYLPFGGGQRKCIGANFATMEATLALASLAQRFRVEVPADHQVGLLPRFALRPKGGVPVRLTAL